MNENEQLPLKRVELSLTKFNEVAIPHHLDLLRQHKANITKYEQCGEWWRVRSEQTNAGRVSRQLRSLLAELEALRRRVRPQDRAAFDALTQRARDDTLAAIVDYLGVIEGSCRSLVAAARARRESSPVTIDRPSTAPAAAAVSGSAVSTDSVGVVAHQPDLLQLQIHQHESNLSSREAALAGWGELQREVSALHDAWLLIHRAAVGQREQVEVTASRVEESAENVSAATASLSAAERLKAAAWSGGGALIGLAAGGPVGLAVGAKAGAAAALLGGLLGYFGASVLGRRRDKQIRDAESEREALQLQQGSEKDSATAKDSVTKKDE